MSGDQTPPVSPSLQRDFAVLDTAFGQQQPHAAAAAAAGEDAPQNPAQTVSIESVLRREILKLTHSWVAGLAHSSGCSGGRDRRRWTGSERAATWEGIS